MVRLLRWCFSQWSGVAAFSTSSYVVFLIINLLASYHLNAQVRWDGGSRHDFGEIAAGKSVRHTFLFTNLGNTPLTIETTRTTCGCTATEYSTEPVLPGAQGSITVTFDGQVPIGKQFKKKIKLYFIERRKGETLRIRGVVN